METSVGVIAKIILVILQSSYNANHLDLVQTLEAKGTVPNNTVLTSGGSHKFGGPQAT